MENPRKYGRSPHKVAVLHGGPGAAGGMASVAREISRYAGVLEPIQTKDSVNGQVEELREILTYNTELPVILVGFSWGAWLSILTAARYPELAKKLILVGAGPFEQKYAERLTAERINRLNEEDRIKALELAEDLETDAEDKLVRLFNLFHGVDEYEALPAAGESESGFDIHIYRRVWPEAEKMRVGGELLRLAGDIRCPVVAVHGDYDTHPWEGVREPLSRCLKDFRFILLEKCGHDPSIERYARDRFYAILQREIITADSQEME